MKSIILTLSPLEGVQIANSFKVYKVLREKKLPKDCIGQYIRAFVYITLPKNTIRSGSISISKDELYLNPCTQKITYGSTVDLMGLSEEYDVTPNCYFNGKIPCEFMFMYDTKREYYDIRAYEWYKKPRPLSDFRLTGENCKDLRVDGRCKGNACGDGEPLCIKMKGCYKKKIKRAPLTYYFVEERE